MLNERPRVSRIPCLDGIRALSIMLVILSHATGTVGGPPMEPGLLALGELGVRIFFVISGFLITTLLLAEYNREGSISLGRFYLRRTFRIFPAMYFLVLCMVFADTMGWITLRPGDVFHAATYTTNYHFARSWELAHIWSLSVEEQFYLIWPALFLLFGIKGAIGASALLVLVAPFLRMLTYLFFPEQRLSIGSSFHTVADSIAIGCVFAYIRPWLSQKAVYLRVQRSGLFACLLVLIIFLFTRYEGRLYFQYAVEMPVSNLAIMLFIDWCLRNKDSAFGRLLEWQPMVSLGLMSYSLYLWQQPFLNRNSEEWFTSLPAGLVLTFAAALFSYHVIERPFLRWRPRVEQVLFARKPVMLPEAKVEGEA